MGRKGSKPNPTEYNKIRHSRAKVKYRLIFNKRKRESWRAYVDGINCRTNTKTGWTKVKKLKGKSNIITNPIVYNAEGELKTDQYRVANAMVDYFASVEQNNYFQ